MKKRMGEFLFICLLVLAWGLPAWADEQKIRVIEPQKVLEGTKAGKKTMASLEDYVKTRQHLIESEEADLKELEAVLVQKGSVLSPAAKQEKEEAFRQKAGVYQRHVQELQNEIAAKRSEMLGEFTQKLEQAVKEIAAKEGITFVMEQGSAGAGTMVLYSDPSINLTDRVIKTLDSKGGN